MTSDPEGTVYRARAKVALTVPGVVVVGTAIPLVAAVVDALIDDGLGWLFGVPLVVASVYCAWEARPDAFRAVLVTPPLVSLLAVLVAVVLTEGFGGMMTLGLNVFRVLAGQVAPMLLLAEVLAAAVVWYRVRRSRSGGVRPAARP